jgi:hypothetical protein
MLTNQNLLGESREARLQKVDVTNLLVDGFEDILAVWRQKWCNLSDSTRVRRV